MPRPAILRDIYDDHAGVRDRFVGAGVLTPDLAERLGVTGLAGRASGQDLDLRVDLPCEPYTRLDVHRALCSDGDVAARVQVRFDELFESLRLVGASPNELPGGATRSPCRCRRRLRRWHRPRSKAGAARCWSGWRRRREGAIRRCHPHDSSWANWPALEHAVIGNIVPDFPLINKSFNLSYSGHDL